MLERFGSRECNKRFAIGFGEDQGEEESMANHDERWALNHLIEICRDEELTLRAAADHVKDHAARTLLMELASQRARFVDQLTPHAQRLGGADASDGTMRGALHRRWLAAKDAVLGHTEQTYIVEAEQAEREALATYEHALNDWLPPTTRELVERQCAELKVGHTRVQSLLAS